ncbi:sulfate transporter [Alloyangia pacifica]|uniref:Sulfate transporter n=1 Tax=Alloyangia pacifica TaxID=311180 RepID=A0A2U8HEE2_9RHOB|nr:DUF3164 family protein [Alloyangia pacifica]AWI83045.1 sulfate transporter [Alloyangia pacifica]
MTAQPTIPEGYMKNGRGELIPEAKVKPEDKLEDDLVRRMAALARSTSGELAKLKALAMGEAEAFQAEVASLYGAIKGGAKGNMTLRSFDGSLELQVAVSEHITFGPQLKAAKELIDNCIERWAQHSDDNLRVIVLDAFQVNKAGRIDTQRVLGLRRLSIEDAEWKRAMDAISDAVRVSGSKTYVRFYEIDPETGDRSPISLDLASV